MAYRVLLTPNQVRAYGLPMSPLSPKELRASTWKEATGVDQTEVDSLMDRHPDAIAEIAAELIEGRFYDTTLEARVATVRRDWLTRAQEVIDERDGLAQARRRVVARLEQIKADAAAEIEELIASVVPDIDPHGLPSVPDPPLPEIDEDDQPEPLCDSRWSFAGGCWSAIAPRRASPSSPRPGCRQ